MAFRQGDYLQMAILPPLSFRAVESPVHQSMRVKTVTFSMTYRYTNSGWNVEAAVLTEAPLQGLLELREFLLPGEHPAEADERRHARAYR